VAVLSIRTPSSSCLDSVEIASAAEAEIIAITRGVAVVVAAAVDRADVAEAEEEEEVGPPFNLEATSMPIRNYPEV